ncbi:dipeptide epimerase [Glaciecola sp. SC05]|uniref:dipeptide epimerase n=1 Tax=Glaciecola sp. SC05 TaxID=1987355 RepID=UPI0035284FC8
MPIFIQSIELLALKVPLHTPFKTAVREVTHIHDLVVRLCSSDGHVGYGSAPSTLLITGEDHVSTLGAIENVISPMLVNQSLEDFEDLVKKIHHIKQVGSNAKAAIDIALFDLHANSKQQPLYEVIARFGNSTQNIKIGDPVLETDYTISVNPVEQMCQDIDTAVARAYRCLKIKIGNQPELDLQRLRAIYAHVQGKQNEHLAVTLRLDVNQGWDVPTTIKIMLELEQQGIHFELIEQPLIAANIEGLAEIKRAIKTPIMADESAFNLEQVKQLHRLDAVDIINIKLIKAGGIYPAMQIADYCRSNAIKCMIGCMLEGSIGVAAAAHLAVAYPDVITLIDLDGPTLGQYDPVKGATTFEDAHIFLNNTPGLGIGAQHGLPKWGEA